MDHQWLEVLGLTLAERIAVRSLCGSDWVSPSDLRVSLAFDAGIAVDEAGATTIIKNAGRKLFSYGVIVAQAGQSHFIIHQNGRNRLEALRAGVAMPSSAERIH